MPHPCFSVSSPGFWREFVQQNPMGILVHHDDSGLRATHIPFLLLQNQEGAEVLAGHLPLANPQAQMCGMENQALAIFSTPAAYISGAWYGIPAVSTMNYVAVHIQGIPRPVSISRLRYILYLLNEKLESLYNRDHPLRLENLSGSYLEANYKQLLGFEMSIDKVEATCKLSQNKSGKDRQEIIRRLRLRGRPEDLWIAHEMEKS